MVILKPTYDAFPSERWCVKEVMIVGYIILDRILVTIVLTNWWMWIRLGWGRWSFFITYVLMFSLIVGVGYV